MKPHLIIDAESLDQAGARLEHELASGHWKLLCTDPTSGRSAEEEYLDKLPVEPSEFEVALRRGLMCLPYRYAVILNWYYGLGGMALEVAEIGDRLGLTKKAVHHRKEAALTMLRRALCPDGDDATQAVRWIAALDRIREVDLSSQEEAA